MMIDPSKKVGYGFGFQNFTGKNHMKNDLKNHMKNGTGSGGAGSGGSSGRSVPADGSKSKPKFRLEPKRLVQIHDLMVKSRVLEERLIRMYKQSDGYFWIGGPGEEAFSVPLGLQVHKGSGPAFDYLHLHYRSSPILTAMGLDPLGSLRQMKNVASDPFSGGRNFSNHYSIRAWNVLPIASTIGTQYATAIGTGIAQMRDKTREGGRGITIVNGGDAGTAEGEFASCLIWSSRKGQELPVLMIVTNNEYGISTPYKGQHGETKISDRGKAFNIRSTTIDGNDVDESWYAIQEAMEYVRTERKPYFLEARVSRLYGHSSATGANYVAGELDCLTEFENKLEAGDIMTRKEMLNVRESYNQQMLEMWQKVRLEAQPDPSTIYDHTYHGQKGRYW
jgi:2-oxoisovalerate dehydrogenase E1 component alpha subunit